MYGIRLWGWLSSKRHLIAEVERLGRLLDSTEAALVEARLRLGLREEADSR